MSIHERLGYNFPSDHTIIQLVNMNSTCYINSVLQSIYNLPSIQNYLENVSRIINELNISIEHTLFGLFVKIYIDSQRAPQNEVWYEPNYFLDKFFSFPLHFQRYQMGDASEFFLTIVDIFDKEIISINENINKIKNLPNNDLEYNKNNPIRSFSSFFHFLVSNSYNPNYPEFRYPIPVESFSIIVTRSNQNGTEKAINDFFEHPYYRKFLNFPEILVVYFVSIELIDGGIHKVFDKTPISKQIEFSSKINEKVENVTYDLISVVVHNGTDFDSGHYIAVFKACGRVIVGDDANFWGLNDDQLNRFIYQNEIPGNESCSSVYMMYYQKRSN